MNPSLLLATAAEAHSHSMIDALPYMAGMLLVMVSLASLWGITAICAKILQIVIPEPKPAPAVSAPPVVTDFKPAATPAAVGIPPQIVAAIAAAVASLHARQPVRIISIKPNNSSWEQAGRRSVLTSHRIR